MAFRTRFFWAGSAVSAIVSAHSLAFAADYYFDTVGGDDSLGGTTEATAKKTWKLPTGTGNTVYLKRGSSVAGSLNASNITIKAYGCGPRPVFAGGLTVNKATIEGLRGMPTSSAGIMVQSDSYVLDCESDGTKFSPSAGNSAGAVGMSVNGTNNHIIGNFVHDWGASQSGVSMNNSGGAEGIMVMASNNEVAFNSVVNCYSPNTTLGGVEGGCLEIVNPKNDAVISNVSFHHNYCERSVGLWEGCSGNFDPDGAKIQEHHGIIENVTVSYNISVDAMWMYLLQPVNTDFKNVVFANNTIIHTPKSKEWWTMPVSTDYPKGLVYTDGGHAMMGIGVDNDTVTDSAGVTTKYTTENAYYKMATGFEPGTIIVKNNIFADTVESGVNNMMFMLKVADHSNNIFIPSTANLGVFTLGATEKKANLADLAFTADYQLTAASTLAIDQGATIDMTANQSLASTTVNSAYFGTTFTQDVAKQAVPCGSAPDIGASEFCVGPTALTWPTASSDSCGTGGASTAGGATSVSTGGVSSGTGGASTGPTAGAGAGGKSSVVATGGAAVVNAGGTVGAGGKAATGGKANVGGATLVIGAGGSAVVSATGGASVAANAGGGAQNATGGAGPANTGDTTAVASAGGQDANSAGSSSVGAGVGGAAAGAPAGTDTVKNGSAVAADEGGCTCTAAGSNRSGISTALASLGLAVLAMRRRKQSRR